MKQVLVLISVVFSFFSFAHAAERIVVGEARVDGTVAKITTDAPVKNGGSLKFAAIRAEVNGKVYRLSNNSSRLMYESFCQDYEFKNFYAKSESSSGNDLSVDIGRMNISDNSVVLTDVFCMENAY